MTVQEYTIPHKMSAAFLKSFERIDVEEIDVPSVGPGEALVRMRACGICSGDVMPWYIEKKAPLVLGHEPAGEVVKVGPGVTGFAPGDRVFVHHHAPCMACELCARGDYVQCPTWRATRIIPGGLAEYVLVPETNLKNDTLRLPDNIGFEAGTLVEPLACVVNGVRRMGGFLRGGSVVVIGLGVMGMLFVVLARHYGAGRIIGLDMNPWRLDKAMGLGATDVLDARDPESVGKAASMTGGGAGRVVIGPGSIKAMESGIGLAGPGGTVLFFTPTPPGEVVSFDQNLVYFKDLSFVQSYSCGPDDTREALGLIASGVIPVDDIITHRFPLKLAGEAFRMTAAAGESLKCIVTL